MEPSFLAYQNRRDTALLLVAVGLIAQGVSFAMLLSSLHAAIRKPEAQFRGWWMDGMAGWLGGIVGPLLIPAGVLLVVFGLRVRDSAQRLRTRL